MNTPDVSELTMMRLIRLNGIADVLLSRPSVPFEDFTALLEHPQGQELINSWKVFLDAKEAHEQLISKIKEAL